MYCFFTDSPPAEIYTYFTHRFLHVARPMLKVVVVEDDGGRRRWRSQRPIPERLQPRQENTIEALEIAARAARDENRLRHARALEDLRDSLITRLSPRDALRSEADAEAVLSAMGQVARPGPKVAMKPEVTDVLIEALRGPFKMRSEEHTSELQSLMRISYADF